MEPLPAPVERLILEIAPQLRASVREALLEHPDLEPVAAVFDEVTALRVGLITAEEAGPDPRPTHLITRLMHRRALVELCADEPRLSEWLVPSGADKLLLVFRAAGDFRVMELPLDEAAADRPGAAPPAADPWRQFEEAELAHSLFLKHQGPLGALARAALTAQPDRPVAGLIMAPELVARTRAGGQPLAGQDTGELVHLVAPDSIVQILQSQAPQYLDTLHTVQAAGRLPILIGTDNGWQLQSTELPPA